MLAVGVGWQVYALTGSALDLGLVGLAQFIPSFLLMLVAGHVADRFDRRRVLQACMVVEALAALGLCIGSASSLLTAHAIFALIFVVGWGLARLESRGGGPPGREAEPAEAAARKPARRRKPRPAPA